MTAQERMLLEKVRGLAFANRVEFTDHAYEKMDERNVTVAEVIDGLVGASKLKIQDSGTLRVTTEDSSGDDLTIIAVIEEDCLVITVF